MFLNILRISAQNVLKIFLNIIVTIVTIMLGKCSSAPASLSVCKFSLHYPHELSCLVTRIKQMIIHSSLSKITNKILPTCLQGNYRDSLGEFSITSCGMFVAETLKGCSQRIEVFCVKNV